MHRSLLLLALALILSPCFASPRAARAAGQVFSLSAGFNFIGPLFTAESANGFAVEAMTSAWLLDEQSPGGVPGVQSVFRFDAASQSFQYQLKLPSGAPFGTAFPLEPYRGYVVKVDAARRLAVGGYVGAAAPLDLVAGFNLIACPPVARFADFASVMNGVAGAESVFAWEASSQSFVFQLRLPSGTLFGANRTLVPGEGMIVRVAQGTRVELTGTGTGPDLMLWNAWFEGSMRAGGLATLKIPVSNLSATAAADTFPLRWTLTPADPIGRPLGGAVTGERSFGPLAAGAIASLATEILLPATEGDLLVRVEIPDGAPLLDPNPTNNSTTLLQTVLPPALAPVLATGSTPVDGTFLVTGLSLAGKSASDLGATIIGANGWGYGCETVSFTDATATFRPYWGQTAGPYRVTVRVGQEWAVADTLEVAPVTVEALPGHIFRVRGVAAPRIYMSGVAGYGIYSDLNTSDQSATIDGAPAAVNYMAATSYPDPGLVRVPALAAKAGTTAQVRFVVNGVEQASGFSYTVPAQAVQETWWVLDQHGAMPLSSYTAGVGSSRVIINGDIRPRRARIAQTGFDTGRLEPGGNATATFASAGTYTLELSHFTIDGGAWVESSDGTKTVVVE